MKKWNLIIDVDNCTNCNMCTLASKDEHVGNAFPGYSAEMPKRGAEWIKIEKKGAWSNSDDRYRLYSHNVPAL